MSKTKTKFAPEVRARAVRIAKPIIRSVRQPIVSISEKIGCVLQTLCQWVKKAVVDSGKHSGVSTEMVFLLSSARMRGCRTSAPHGERATCWRGKVQNPYYVDCGVTRCLIERAGDFSKRVDVTDLSADEMASCLVDWIVTTTS